LCYRIPQTTIIACQNPQNQVYIIVSLYLRRISAHWITLGGIGNYHLPKIIFTIYKIYFLYSCYMTRLSLLRYQVKSKNYEAPCQCHLQYFARFGVLIAMFLNMQVFWHFRQYRLVNIYHRFEGS